MSKAVLVMNMPENCQECIARNDYYCEADSKKRDAYFHEIPGWCPLVPLPEKKESDPVMDHDIDFGMAEGWNACIDAITNSQP